MLVSVASNGYYVCVIHPFTFIHTHTQTHTHTHTHTHVYRIYTHIVINWPELLAYTYIHTAPHEPPIRVRAEYGLTASRGGGAGVPARGGRRRGGQRRQVERVIRGGAGRVPRAVTARRRLLAWRVGRGRTWRRRAGACAQRCGRHLAAHGSQFCGRKLSPTAVCASVRVALGPHGPVYGPA